MARLGPNRWGKSQVRVSKLHRGGEEDDFTDLTAQVLLEGDVEGAHTVGDNSVVLPTDTMRNTVYALAQDHLDRDLEAFAARLAAHFLERPDVHRATISFAAKVWTRVTPTGFVGGSPELRTVRHEADRSGSATWAGIEGLVVLKTSGSGFAGFPKDRYTILPETEDRLLATSVTATWRYAAVPADTTTAWERGRRGILDSFFSRASASVQHQGWLMANALLDAIPEAEEVSFRLPNQHHLPFDLARFGIEDRGVVFHPVPEPYGDIGFTVTR